MPKNMTLNSRTRLDTLLFLMGDGLSKLKAQIEEEPDLGLSYRAGLMGKLDNLRNVVEMLDEIAARDQDILHDVARVLLTHDLGGSQKPEIVNEALAPYVTHMGDMASEQLFADLLEA